MKIQSNEGNSKIIEEKKINFNSSCIQLVRYKIILLYFSKVSLTSTFNFYMRKVEEFCLAHSPHRKRLLRKNNSNFIRCCENFNDSGKVLHTVPGNSINGSFYKCIPL